MSELTANTEFDNSKPLYPGVADYYEGNNDWLTKLGFDSAEDLNLKLEEYYDGYLRTDATNRESGFSTVTIPSPEAYAPKFLEHIEDNKEKYKEMADAEDLKYKEALRIAALEKPIRRQRTDAYAEKMLRTSDKLFANFEIDEVDIHQPVYFGVSQGVIPNTTYDLDIMKKSMTDSCDDVEIGAFYKALGFFPDALRSGKSSVGNMIQASDGILAFNFDAFDTGILNTSALSVGEYGPDITRKIAQTVAVFGILLKKNEDDFRDLHEEFGHTLVRSQDVVGDEPVPMLSLYEGVLSVGQSINTMVQDRVEGYDRPEELVKDLIDQGVLLKFARSFSTMGIIGPMNLLGYKFPHLIDVADSIGGRLVLDAGYTKAQKEDRELKLIHQSGKIASSIVSSEAFDKNKIETYITIEGCPATVSIYNKETGESRNVTREIAELFLEIFERIDLAKIKEAEKLDF